MERYPCRWLANPQAATGEEYGPREAAILSREAAEMVHGEILSWPVYLTSPLHALPGLAAELGLGGLWVKDESRRFGLNSFKALGGAYAVLRLVQTEVQRRTQRSVSSSWLQAGDQRQITEEITVATATAGNHGRAVAWGARQFGCRSVVYVSQSVSPLRCKALSELGAEVVRVPGTYDDAVARVRHDAEINGWEVLMDTAWENYRDIPRWIMLGYTLLASEVTGQLPDGERPDLVLVQGGVGGLAAAVCAWLWESWGTSRPRFVVVEPERAACLMESALKGLPVVVEGGLETIMGGLAAGAPSLDAWEILRRGADGFLAIGDDAARQAMCLLARGRDGDARIVAGESGGAGLAGLLSALENNGARQALGLNTQSRVLIINSEGATDPESYREIVGEPPETVGMG
ncbi:MAG: diaminopropionate ammonia-lyase [Deltaproteobacteria bacterium]|nr:diaminopropionate ammonia-lyase [Deltaproteobacteria bacterium]